MLQVLGSAWALLIGIFLLMIGNGLQGSLIGIRGAIENFSTLNCRSLHPRILLGSCLARNLRPN